MDTHKYIVFNSNRNNFKKLSGEKVNSNGQIHASKATSKVDSC